jgi:DNA repair protein RadC
MKTIRNYELKIRRIQVSEAIEPYGTKITEPGHVADIARSLIGDAAEEHFFAFMLDIRNRIVGFSEVARGSIDACSVDARSVFRTAVITGASSLAICHNHPSGKPAPSTQDIALTKRLVDCGQLLGLPIIDHVIVTDGDTFSFAADGLMPDSSVA